VRPASARETGACTGETGEVTPRSYRVDPLARDPRTFRMGHEGLLVLVTIIRASAPVTLDTTPLALDDKPLAVEFARSLDDKPLAIEFARSLDNKPLAIELSLALPAKQPELDLHFELRDNSAEGDWSRTEDFELVATNGRLSLALNNHFIVRNIREAQLVASFAIEY
jgi:hypothetical protein